MKRTTILLSSIIASIILQGCGSDKPSEIVEKYIGAWNDGNIEEISEYASNELVHEIQVNIDNCISNSKDNEISEKYKAYKEEVRTAWKDYNPIDNNPALGEKKDEFFEKTNTIIDDKSLTKEQRTEQCGIVLLGYLGNADEVKKKLSPTAYRAFAYVSFSKLLNLKGIYTGSEKGFYKQIILEEIKEKGDAGAKKECLTNFFKPGDIKNFNIVETKEISPEKQLFNVELVKSQESEKKVIGVELINKEWRVVSAR